MRDSAPKRETSRARAPARSIRPAGIRSGDQPIDRSSASGKFRFGRILNFKILVHCVPVHLNLAVSVPGIFNSNLELLLVQDV
eukprot:SAG31_NODE_4899_length_2878_cov_1.365599_6_plen_83_part_00